MTKSTLEKRLQEAKSLMEQGMHRQAVETAGGGIDLLMKELFEELKQKLNRHDAAAMQGAYNNRAPKSGGQAGKLTFGGWIGLFNDENLFARLEGAFNYKFRYFNPGILQTILQVRNDCVHEDYQPTSAESGLVSNNFALFLKETGRAPAEVAEKAPEPKQERARGALPPWSQIATPNRDIRERRFDLGIFAIHLGEIAFGDGSGQYQYADPEAFYDLTYITRGLRSQLVTMMQRLGGTSTAYSVVQLDTTFGGGKTHTLLALYHLAKYGTQLAHRPEIREVMKEAGIKALPECEVAVLDGSHLSPSTPRHTPEGLTLHTLWGELAYQIGGVEGYEYLQESDETRVAPGAGAIGDLLRDVGKPVLILIDELLDYATKASGYDPEKRNFTNEAKANAQVGQGYLVDQVQSFIKALTQAVDRNPNALLVLTLTSSPQQIFGEAARRMHQEIAGHHATFRNILERVQRSEVIAESVEIYEILRRRLFEQVGELTAHQKIAKAYWDYYRESSNQFPQPALDPAYRDRIAAAYPFHPDLIDVLRDRWGTIQGFQKTRGVLRLLALVVSNLYRKNHGAPLIQLGHIDLADPEIRRELLGHVDSPAGYDAAIGSDIAGLDESKAERLDQQIGGDYYRFGLCEGLATTLFMYSHSGAGGFVGGTRPELWLGILQPDLMPALAADTYSKLEGELWYMEKEGTLSRLGVDPNLNMMLVKRMDALRQETEKLDEYIRQTIEQIAGDRFGKPIIWTTEPRLVRDTNQLKLIIAPLQAYYKENDPELRAHLYMEKILKSTGDRHRQFRNTIIFLLPTHDGIANIDQAAIRLMALEDIEQATGKQLKDRQREELKDQLRAAKVGLPSAVWGAYIVTATAGRGDDPWIVWESGISAFRPDDKLSQRAWERLKEEYRLLEQFDPDYIVKRDEERFKYLWPVDQEYVKTQDLWDAFARYDYLPMLADMVVLQNTIAWGVNRGLFAYCTGTPESFDNIYIDRHVPANQCVISEHAWLLDAKRARELLTPPAISDEWQPSDEQTGESTEVDEPNTIGERTATVSKRYGEISVDLDVEPLDWRQFYNSVIEPLIKKGAHVRIRINLSASHENGFDVDFVELSIRESIVQINRNAQIDIEEK